MHILWSTSGGKVDPKESPMSSFIESIGGDTSVHKLFVLSCLPPSDEFDGSFAFNWVFLCNFEYSLILATITNIVIIDAVKIATVDKF
jgi:hypothetical protein